MSMTFIVLALGMVCVVTLISVGIAVYFWDRSKK